MADFFQIYSRLNQARFNNCTASHLLSVREIRTLRRKYGFEPMRPIANICKDMRQFINNMKVATI